MVSFRDFNDYKKSNDKDSMVDIIHRISEVGAKLGDVLAESNASNVEAIGAISFVGLKVLGDLRKALEKTLEGFEDVSSPEAKFTDDLIKHTDSAIYNLGVITAAGVKSTAVDSEKSAKEVASELGVEVDGSGKAVNEAYGIELDKLHKKWTEDNPM